MTMTLVWTGVTLWLAFNAAVGVCILTAEPNQARHPSDRARYRM